MDHLQAWSIKIPRALFTLFPTDTMLEATCRSDRAVSQKSPGSLDGHLKKSYPTRKIHFGLPMSKKRNFHGEILELSSYNKQHYLRKTETGIGRIPVLP